MSERLWNILLDSFWKIFLPGLKVTIPLTVISFSIALVIATAMAARRYSDRSVSGGSSRLFPE